MQGLDIDNFVADFVSASEPAKREMLAALLPKISNDHQDDKIVGLGSRLMYRGQAQWAEAIFAAAMTTPHLKDGAEYERAVLWSLQGKLDSAIESFSSIYARTNLAPHQRAYIARQYARIGQFDKARRLVDEAVLSDQSLYRESLADLQFFDFLENYPAVKAYAAFEQLKASYEFADTERVFGDLQQALDTGTPYSIIRIGDGEGIHIRLSAEDEKNYCMLYERGRAEIHRIWYAGTQLLNTPEWASEAMRVQAAYRNADCLGMLHDHGLRHEFTIGSPRGIPALYNMVRFAEEIKNTPERPRLLCDPNIHRLLLSSGSLAKILAGRKFVGLISCYDDLPSRLEQHFGIGEVVLHKTSGEFIARQSIEGENTNVGFAREFMDRHYEVCRALEHVRPGQLYLVTGGIWGRLYCDLIKRGGGIAIEIGSVADIWMNVGTRAFSDAEKAFTLKGGPADDHHSRMASLHQRMAAV